MSATTKQAADFEVGAVAHVSFRVRCEKLGHGEEVFLVADGGDPASHKTIPLYTTATQHPWYHSVSPLTLSLPPRTGIMGETRKKTKFTYRYAIHRAGAFHRWEMPSDSPMADIALNTSTSSDDYDNKLVGGDDDISMEEERAFQDDTQTKALCHQLPLHLMHNRESYIVSDVLGETTGLPDVEKIRAPNVPTVAGAATLHARSSSSAQDVSSTLLGIRPASGSALAEVPGAGGGGKGSAPGTPKPNRKKAVGFAPGQPLYHQKPVQPVHLNSTDGLVVVSIFLPVILHRSENGQWSADWDYEVLLSMQTHLRVTRVGLVKWKGYTETGSLEHGVPRSERLVVEECLRPLNCVPVWIESQLFGEMYNGFCKGVLWPVLHNVTSVYSNKSDEDDMMMQGRSASSDSSEYQQPIHHSSQQNHQFSEYSMDDIEQGPIHGGRGREAELWTAYNTVNRQFAERVVQCFHEGDLVWVHGFHLMILPSYLTRRIPMAKVGIFLHTPFPSSEIFRTVWCREDLLRGMLNADQVGFHLFEYARHFLTCCRRLLGLNYGMIPDSSGGHTLAIDTNGRNVVVTSIHAGVEPPVLNQILTHATTVDKATTMRQRYQGKTIFCCIDRLESLKGIPLKLLGLERFLTRRPEWVGKIVLIQIGISAFERGDDYFLTLAETNKLVHKINSTWPGSVQFQECNESEMRLQQRMALMRASDVCVVTSIRDGLNLLPLEFTIAHQDALTELGKKDGRKRGLCILSEFSSCTRVMRGALHVNPWKISEIASAYDTALHMSEDERLRRISIASEFTTRVTTQRWALAVMLDLKGVHKSVNPGQYAGAGLGLGYRLLGMDPNFLSLDTTLVAKAYKNSKARLILLDYGGTIVCNDNLNNLTRFQMVKERSAPSEPLPEMLNTIKALCEDRRNTVFVVSGKERHSLTKTLGGIKNLGLAAEHGMFISWPTNKTAIKRRWETLVPETDRTWRSLAVSIMEVYTSRTHGSYIEETEMKVLWQYRDADTEFGSLQAKELEDHLSKYLHTFPVDILHGGIKEGGYVEVRPKGVNKGVLSMRVLKRFPDVAQKERCDFALVIGDDHCDEPMLSVMRQIGRRVTDARRAQNGEEPLPEMPATIQIVDVSSCDPFVSPDLETFTTTVGKKPSAAATYMHDVDEVQELLESLVKISTRERAFTSAADLTSYASSQMSIPSTFQRPAPLGGQFSNSMPLPKSTSLDQMSLPQGKSISVSATLNDFLRLGTIEDDDDDDPLDF